ncbi:MAG: tRNA (adenosine(37)-N6)-dimethylallyltransferase MiaA [Caulobacterales bacterium]
MHSGAAHLPIILLQGPTASGKSALALDLAEKLDGAIINADALQLYRDWRVLSARPNAAETARRPHHLFGHVDAAERYSVGRWLKECLQVIAAVRAAGQRPVIVGGTGLYFRALTEGLAEIPAIPEAVQEHVLARLTRDGAPALHAQLQVFDPDGAARIKPTDSSRILRATAVFEAFGEAITALQANTLPPLAPDSWRGLALAPPRDVLYAGINARFAAMIEQGALEEARALLARDLLPDLPAMKAVGAPPLFAHLRGEIDLKMAIELAARDTRRFAKRQFTWIGNQVPHWTRIEGLDPSERLGVALTALAAG